MESISKLVSVVIPTYGRGVELSYAIDSALSQTYANIEIIIVDDNDSIENINEVKTQLGKYSDNKKITYLGDGVNRGGAGARNFGISHANGVYITFLDDDDFYDPKKIEKQLFHLEKESLDVSVCDLHFCEDGELKDVSNCYARVNSLKDFIIKGNCYTPMIFAKKETLESVEGFTITPRFQDHLLMLKILASGSKVGHLGEKLFTHHNHKGERITFSLKSLEGFKKRFSEEDKYLSLLSNSELQSYSFARKLIEMKIARSESDFGVLFSLSLQALLDIRTASQLHNYLKCIFRNAFLPSRHF